MLKLKCPSCGAILNVKNASGQEEKVITCPRCKVGNMIKNFTRVTIQKKAQTEEKSECDQPTMLNLNQPESKSKDVGYGILDVKTGKVYRLKKGKNLVGRKTIGSPSVADVPLETADMGFSRAHLYIEIVSMASNDKVFLSNARNKNQTFVNSSLVEADDKLVLHHGDMIVSSETTLKFITE